MGVGVFKAGEKLARIGRKGESGFGPIDAGIVGGDLAGSVFGEGNKIVGGFNKIETIVTGSGS